MIGAKIRAMLIVLPGMVCSTVVQAQTPTALIYDPGVAAISFAAGDLQASLAQNGYAVTNLPLGNPSNENNETNETAHALPK